MRPVRVVVNPVEGDGDHQRPAYLIAVVDDGEYGTVVFCDTGAIRTLPLQRLTATTIDDIRRGSNYL